MKRMSALKSASAVFQGSSKESDFKRLSCEIVKFIEVGAWNGG